MVTGLHGVPAVINFPHQRQHPLFPQSVDLLLLPCARFPLPEGDKMISRQITGKLSQRNLEINGNILRRRVDGMEFVGIDDNKISRGHHHTLAAAKIKVETSLVYSKNFHRIVPVGLAGIISSATLKDINFKRHPLSRDYHFMLMIHDPSSASPFSSSLPFFPGKQKYFFEKNVTASEGQNS